MNEPENRSPSKITKGDAALIGVWAIFNVPLILGSAFVMAIIYIPLAVVGWLDDRLDAYLRGRLDRKLKAQMKRNARRAIVFESAQIGGKPDRQPIGSSDAGQSDMSPKKSREALLTLALLLTICVAALALCQH
jgi:hypothetical protein